MNNAWQDLKYRPALPKPIAVRDVYRVCDPKVPKGYEVVDFRLPKAGEYYLLHSSHEAITQACGDHSDPKYPYLILERKKTRKVVFTEVRRGRLERGEWYRHADRENAGFGRHLGDDITNLDLIAYTREDIEE